MNRCWLLLLHMCCGKFTVMVVGARPRFALPQVQMQDKDSRFLWGYGGYGSLYNYGLGNQILVPTNTVGVNRTNQGQLLRMRILQSYCLYCPISDWVTASDCKLRNLLLLLLFVSRFVYQITVTEMSIIRKCVSKSIERGFTSFLPFKTPRNIIAVFKPQIGPHTVLAEPYTSQNKFYATTSTQDTKSIDDLEGRPLYLDAQATTALDPRVLDAMLPYMTSYYGNPHSRTHAYGWESEQAMEHARKEEAKGASRANSEWRRTGERHAKAIGADEDLAHSSIRFGFGRFTTEAEVDFTAERCIQHVTRLREMSPLWEMVQEGIDLKSIKWTQH
ncbi:hypothetical protein B566_EDAN016358 [Ephemera danica]|nr:hypothetical protein B566_EDAN016358 [Ephemera danica]